MSYFINNAIAFDQQLNTLVGGQPDETLSARAYRRGVLDSNRKWNYFRVFVNCLFFFQKDHCMGAYESEIERRHLHSSYRK